MHKLFTIFKRENDSVQHYNKHEPLDYNYIFDFLSTSRNKKTNTSEQL
jgi:hypothetical protein